MSYTMRGSSYMSPRAYAIMHRMHHAFTDTEKDPHSPRYSGNVFTMMMRTNKIYMGIYKGTLQVDDKFMKNIPDWPAFDKGFLPGSHPSSGVLFTLSIIVCLLQIGGCIF